MSDEFWESAGCWLADFTDTSCDLEERPLDKAHLLPKSRLKKEHVPEEALWDPRVWVFACRKHHSALDTARTLRIPRDRLPKGLEEYAREHGLEWLVDRTYGLPPARVCGYCGHRDQGWHGKPESGWAVRDGKPVCTGCRWVEPWLYPPQEEAA